MSLQMRLAFPWGSARCGSSVTFRCRPGLIEEPRLPRSGDTKFFLYDPDGVGVELNFPKA
jgi:hypothetical protein